jgi:hypothetical protein
MSASIDTDTRTMADLAREALQVQDACNLSGVVLSFGRAVCRLRHLLEEQGNGGTLAVNRHPICKAWASKIADLSGCEPGYVGMWGDVERLAGAATDR